MKKDHPQQIGSKETHTTRNNIFRTNSWRHQPDVDVASSFISIYKRYVTDIREKGRDLAQTFVKKPYTTIKPMRLWRKALEYSTIHWNKICTQNQWKRNTCIPISSQHELDNQNFVFIRLFYFTYSINRLFFLLNNCQCALFKSPCSKTSYLTHAACQQRTLTPPDTWSCTTLGLACVLFKQHKRRCHVNVMHVETNLTWTCIVSGLFELRASLGTSLLLTFCSCSTWVICILFADWVDIIFISSKCRYVFSISKYSKIKSLKNANNFSAGCSGKLWGRFPSCVWTYTPFCLY